ncbi:melanopsin-like [Exaiptasia diaphana]|uniref:G-protein coupled receptors family 1 profile domain-containing protein n=1 Tax=Exaiptasia diaphana TaxID=2652724 RepID=A0A913X242_EXADI|nr:melanopsin-like [Exaiptasia diaphana]XP_028514118.1 melanopsin-like [Exaiptasia diaphana]
MLKRHELLPYGEIVECAFWAILVGSFVLNTMALATFSKLSFMPTLSHYFLVSMVFNDWLRSVLVQTVAVYMNHTNFGKMSSWYCQYFAFTSTFFGLNSIIHLTALAVEKYKTIVNPLANRRHKKEAKIIIPCLWAFSLAWSVCPLIGWSSYSNVPGHYVGCSISWYSSNASDKVYVFSLFAVFFFVPLSTTMYCYVKIYFVLKTLTNKDIKRWGSESLAAKETIKAKVRSTKMAFAMITGFIFAWTPYTIVSLCAAFGYQVHPLVVTCSAIFAKTSTIYNPVILIFLHTNFRKTLLRCMKRLQCKKYLTNEEPINV